MRQSRKSPTTLRTHGRNLVLKLPWMRPPRQHRAIQKLPLWSILMQRIFQHPAATEAMCVLLSPPCPICRKIRCKKNRTRRMQNKTKMYLGLVLLSHFRKRPTDKSNQRIIITKNMHPRRVGGPCPPPPHFPCLYRRNY